MQSFKIRKQFVTVAMEQDEFGHAPAGYTAWVIDGNGPVVAAVTGDLSRGDLGHGCTGLVVKTDRHPGGAVYTLRDVVDFARKGLYGLSLG